VQCENNQHSLDVASCTEGIYANQAGPPLKKEKSKSKNLKKTSKANIAYIQLYRTTAVLNSNKMCMSFPKCIFSCF